MENVVAMTVVVEAVEVYDMVVEVDVVVMVGDLEVAFVLDEVDISSTSL